MPSQVSPIFIFFYFFKGTVFQSAVQIDPFPIAAIEFLFSPTTKYDMHVYRVG